MKALTARQTAFVLERLCPWRSEFKSEVVGQSSANHMRAAEAVASAMTEKDLNVFIDKLKLERPEVFEC